MDDVDVCFDLKPKDTKKAFGAEWTKATNTSSFTIKGPAKAITGRAIFYYVSYLYNPFGFFATALLPTKLSSKELCRLNLGSGSASAHRHLKSDKHGSVQLLKSKVGDQVLIMDKAAPRGLRLKAVVKEVLTSKNARERGIH
ncbi:hypothetical protein FGIG_06482 [Fasciola gigantica]|uniref:Uncharacterized protein n=1 Tax=Fasciola gigantica TaxID=46835 RepID=A0A504YNL3_FASGI|nr:hypothetical protein FGIG_06482 [Fasciola gigantica]